MTPQYIMTEVLLKGIKRIIESEETKNAVDE